MSRVAAEYVTRTGLTGVRVVQWSPGGRYSYSGAWGAGSGLDAVGVAKLLARFARTKRGYTIKQAFEV